MIIHIIIVKIDHIILIHVIILMIVHIIDIFFWKIIIIILVGIESILIINSIHINILRLISLMRHAYNFSWTRYSVNIWLVVNIHVVDAHLHVGLTLLAHQFEFVAFFLLHHWVVVVAVEVECDNRGVEVNQLFFLMFIPLQQILSEVFLVYFVEIKTWLLQSIDDWLDFFFAFDDFFFVVQWIRFFSFIWFDALFSFRCVLFRFFLHLYIICIVDWIKNFTLCGSEIRVIRWIYSFLSIKVI